jgi:hypothetical protein
MRFRFQVVLWVVCAAFAAARVATNKISAGRKTRGPNNLSGVFSGNFLDVQRLLDLGVSLRSVNLSSN